MGPQRAGPRRSRGPLAALVAAVLIAALVVAVAITDPGGAGERSARTTVETPTPSPEPFPTAAATRAPIPQERTLRLAARTITVRPGPGWTLTRRPRGLTLRRAGTAIRLTAGPRRGRTNRALARDARRGLRRRSRAPLRPATLGGLPARKVTVRGRQLVVAADGRRRWLLSRPAGAGDRVLRSLTIR